MPIDNLSKITSRTGISTTILLEAGNVNATGIITAAGFNGPFTGGGAIAAGIITGTGLEISGVSTFTGDLSIADKIIHTGNTNCFISFPDAGDQIVFEGGGHERFRINGTTGKYLFGRDITGRSARYNNTGVVPTIQIEDDTEASFSVAKFSNNTDSSRIYLQKGRGSTGSAAVVQDDDTLGMIVFNGYNGSGFRNAAQILAEVDGEPTTSGDNTDMPGALVFKTSADGTSAPAERLRITSGGDVGIGTLVAQDSSGLTTKLAVGIVTAATLYGDGSNLTGIAAGGSGQFNTGLTGATAYAVTTSMATALTANASSSYRTVIHSIHVTNISTSEVTVSGEMQASFSFAHTIPIPAGSSVELLKQPKVLGPSETIELQASANSALQATIIAEQKEDTDLWDAQVDITSAATWTDLYTSTSNPSVVQSILLANDDGTNDVKARVVWTDGSDNIQAYLCYDLIVPADSTVELCEQPKYLASGYKLRVYANQADRLEVTASGKQITS